MSSQQGRPARILDSMSAILAEQAFEREHPQHAAARAAERRERAIADRHLGFETMRTAMLGIIGRHAAGGDRTILEELVMRVRNPFTFAADPSMPRMPEVLRFLLEMARIDADKSPAWARTADMIEESLTPEEPR